MPRGELPRPKLVRFITQSEMKTLFKKETGQDIGRAMIRKWYQEIVSQKKQEGIESPHPKKIPEKWFIEFLDESRY